MHATSMVLLWYLQVCVISDIKINYKNGSVMLILPFLYDISCGKQSNILKAYNLSVNYLQNFHKIY